MQIYYQLLYFQVLKIVTSIFPVALQLANITPASKKSSKNSKGTYRPERILPNVPKIYDRLIFSKINDYFEGPFHEWA